MIDLDDLRSQARDASRRAYCPYSNFPVGAAVLAGGRVFTGANVENASYGLTLCAERAAVLAAVLAGATAIEALAVACVSAPDDGDPAARMPCGACRQVIAEFARPETPIVVDRVGVFRLDELLPRPFRLR